MFDKNYPVPTGDKKEPTQNRKAPVKHPLGHYLFEKTMLCNFAISGTGPRQAVLSDLLYATQGEIPVIILHANDPLMMQNSASIWQSKYGANDELGNTAFWVCREGSFEPLWGMDQMDVLEMMEQLAKSAGYTCSAHFSNVVRGHLRLLDYLGCGCCLSGLYYLCNFKNVREFQDNVNALDCPAYEKQSILWELGLADEEHRSQFDMFRNLVLRIAYEAKLSGWTPDNSIGTMNITTAIQKNATMLLPVDSNRSTYLMQYLYQELRIHNQKQFLLLIDDVFLENSGICALLKSGRLGFRFGLISENIVEMLGSKDDNLEMVAEKLHRLILFKHSMDTTAQTLSDLIGKDYVERESVTKSVDRDFGAWLPGRTGKSKTTSREKEHRVESKEIINLARGQAIVFDTINNRIIRH